jgi:DNA topoisomerase-2
MIIDGKLIIAKRKKADLIDELKQKGFKPFPKVSDAMKNGEDAPIADDDEESEEDIELGSHAYDYLLGVSN